mmetsp:Transcript_11185/g.45515  ORF Transcript_11185/g.45515 Transcript_11185/m.45515 type:complete len:364 (+) Transcript_11185:113-1204(+)
MASAMDISPQSAQPPKARLRKVGMAKRDLRTLLQKQQMEDRMDVDDVPLRPTQNDVKKKKKRASLLRASEQCNAVLLALRHIMDDSREDAQQHSVLDCDLADFDADFDMDVDTDDDFEGLFNLDQDMTGSGRYVIPCNPQQPLHEAQPVVVLRKSSKRRRKKRKRYLENEKAQKCNSLPLGFKLDTSQAWEVDTMTAQMDGMRIKNHRRSHKRSPSHGSPEATDRKSHLGSSGMSCDPEHPPSKRKAVAAPTSGGHKPPVDLPMLRLSDIPRDPCKKPYSPDISKSCNIISPRSAFSRSPRGASPIRLGSPVNPAHQRPALSPSPRTKSPLGSPSANWTPRSTARMTNTLLRSASPHAHQNAN